MNICTYVSAISRKPKMYAVAIEYGSKSFHNLEKTDEAILQLLNIKQTQLVKILGKKSGHKYPKTAVLEKMGELASWKNKVVLRDCAAYLLLKKTGSFITGDHFLYTFLVQKSQTLSDDNILMFQDLIDQKVILG